MSYGRGRRRSRFDGRFYAVAAAVLAVAIAGKVAGADSFDAYPRVHVGLGPSTFAVAALVALAGLAPLHRAPKRRSTTAASQGEPRRA